MSRAAAAEIVAYHRGLMSAYCAANLRARGAPEVPQILRDLPEIEVPTALREPAPDGHAGNGRAPHASVAALRTGAPGAAS